MRVNGGLRPLVNMLEDPGRPGSPITGQRSDLEVARSAALGLWSCSRSRKNKLVSECVMSSTVLLEVPAAGSIEDQCCPSTGSATDE